LLHDPTQLVRDVQKDRPFAKDKIGKLIEDAMTTVGDFTGIGSAHVGKITHYGVDLATGQQKPKTAGDVYRGFVTGQQRRKEVH
jgi:hypothetical protein